MALENEPPGHNRLERMGLPGYGKNPGSHRDLPPRHEGIPSRINDSGIDLEGAEFEKKYGSTPRRAPQENTPSKESSRMMYALMAASVIAIGSLLANCVQWQKHSKSEEIRQSQREKLQDTFHRYDALEAEYLKERTARRSAELTARLQKTDVELMRQEVERVRELYRAKVLEAQRPLSENGDRVSDNTNNGRRVSGRKSTGIDD